MTTYVLMLITVLYSIIISTVGSTEQFIKIFSKSQYAQGQYPNRRSCYFLIWVKCVNVNV